MYDIVVPCSSSSSRMSVLNSLLCVAFPFSDLLLVLCLSSTVTFGSLFARPRTIVCVAHSVGTSRVRQCCDVPEFQSIDIIDLLTYRPTCESQSADVDIIVIGISAHPVMSRFVLGRQIQLKRNVL